MLPRSSSSWSVIWLASELESDSGHPGHSNTVLSGMTGTAVWYLTRSRVHSKINRNPESRQVAAEHNRYRSDHCFFPRHCRHKISRARGQGVARQRARWLGSGVECGGDLQLVAGEHELGVDKLLKHGLLLPEGILLGLVAGDGEHVPVGKVVAAVDVNLRLGG